MEVGGEGGRGEGKVRGQNLLLLCLGPKGGSFSPNLNAMGTRGGRKEGGEGLPWRRTESPAARHGTADSFISPPPIESQRSVPPTHAVAVLVVVVIVSFFVPFCVCFVLLCR